jgi:hypothetical protein
MKLSNFDLKSRNEIIKLIISFLHFRVSVRVMVFNTTFNNISATSWWSVLLVEETGGPGENYRPVASH